MLSHCLNMKLSIFFYTNFLICFSSFTLLSWFYYFSIRRNLFQYISTLNFVLSIFMIYCFDTGEWAIELFCISRNEISFEKYFNYVRGWFSLSSSRSVVQQSWQIDFVSLINCSQNFQLSFVGNQMTWPFDIYYVCIEMILSVNFHQMLPSFIFCKICLCFCICFFAKFFLLLYLNCHWKIVLLHERFVFKKFLLLFVYSMLSIFKNRLIACFHISKMPHIYIGQIMFW